MIDEPLVSLKAAAAYLNVSTKTVKRMVERGELEARYAGVQLRFEPAVLRSHSSAPPVKALPEQSGGFRAALAGLSYDAA